MDFLHPWQRLESAGLPVYIDPERPDWFVPDATADVLLRGLKQGLAPHAAARKAGFGEPAAGLLAVERLRGQLNSAPPPPYRGRAAALRLTGLKECWFHLTDRCNLACRHCLFAASPGASRSLAPEALRQGLAEARALGATLLCFTGGEPFVYPGFTRLLAELFTDPAVHAVVLTNGLLLAEELAALKALPADRLHLQVSLDGLGETHEALRGAGTFARLLANLDAVQAAGLAVTLSVAVESANVDELPGLVAFAAERGIKNLHFLWHFVRGKGSAAQFVAPARILPRLCEAQLLAEERGVVIDNVEALAAQVFSSPGTRFDLSNSGWESLAVGPDGVIYPSPALVGVAELAAGPLADGLEAVWRQSPVLETVRRATLIDAAAGSDNPLGFLVGGGDIDHSYLAGGTLVGHDPYLELYRGLALWLIARQAGRYPARAVGELLLRMGEVRRDCPSGGEVALTHCNCVVSLAGDAGHESVRAFYGAAARTANEEIANPFAPEQQQARFIPAESRKKSYGCGSPVSDAGLGKGEVVVDLGSGSGVECFMAAEKVGPEGKVFGIDMTDDMLALARRAQPQVAARLGYDNVEFRQGYLEQIPLADGTAHAVISNCVINLSPDKRRTFHEIFRILRPGGRLVVSDIATDRAIPVTIKNDARFRGECLGGALEQEQLLGMLRGAGFVGLRLVKRFPYREEGGVTFYSLTFSGYKPEPVREVEVVYRGPFAAVTTEAGILLPHGKRVRLGLAEARALDESVFVLDQAGAVTNLAMASSCCAPFPQPAPLPLASAGGSCCGGEGGDSSPKPGKIVSLTPKAAPQAAPENGRHRAGCMVCGGTLTYLAREREAACHYCGGRYRTNALCDQEHFVCDHCHQQDGLSAIRLLCAESREEDMLRLLQQIRRHPAIPLHGPEHHAMVPGVILATYRNRGGRLDREAILTGIERGSRVPGGVCGFWGNCGAAAGVGIAFSVLLAATPLTPQARQQAQGVTTRVLGRIAAIRGGRCCQRESVTALREAAAISRELLPVSLLAEAAFVCEQSDRNRECIGRRCPLSGGGAALGEEG